MLTRLARVKPLALVESMVPAAASRRWRRQRIERVLLIRATRAACARGRVHRMASSRERRDAPHPNKRSVACRSCRLTFNTVLGQFDLFADVLTQRSELETGVWLSGLDAVASDALALPGRYYVPPPVMCYLDRGCGRSDSPGHGPGCREAARIRWPSSVCRASGWWAAASPRRSCTRSAIRRPRYSTWSTRFVRFCERCRPRAATNGRRGRCRSDGCRKSLRTSGPSLASVSRRRWG